VGSRVGLDIIVMRQILPLLGIEPQWSVAHNQLLCCLSLPRSCKISSSHGSKCEAQNLLGCTTMFLIEFI
jgi:hypothetical protein